MKRYLCLLACLWPALASAQQTYTNADLVKLEVPGAYTNDDLRRLPPLAVQKSPAAATPLLEVPPAPTALYQAEYDGLERSRSALAAERDFERARADFSESALAGDDRAFAPRLGYRSRVASLMLELEKRIAILDHQMETLVHDALRAGVEIETR